MELAGLEPATSWVRFRGSMTGRDQLPTMGLTIPTSAREAQPGPLSRGSRMGNSAPPMGALPAAAVHDLVERSPVEPLERSERSVGRVAERDEVCEEVV